MSKESQRVRTPLVSTVDNDWSLVESTVGLVQSLGHVAEGFCSAEDFLKSRQLPKTDCLILDLRMPSKAHKIKENA